MSRFSPLPFAFLLAWFALPATAVEQLSVRQSSPIDAVLTWTHSTGNPGGHVVEYINHPTDAWVILEFSPPGRNTFTHARLAPHTPYRYRVRPFFGPTSKPVVVTIAEGLSDQGYLDAYAQPEDYSWAPPKRLAVPGEAVLAKNSIRLAATASRSAPADLVAHVVKTTVSGFKLTWTDRSNDEEGFLLEQLGNGTDFTVCAVVEPDINAFGWALEPPARQAAFRVRAYYYGKPSNAVSIVTGADPAETSATGDAAHATPGPASAPAKSSD